MARILSVMGTILVLSLAACGGQLPAWHHPKGYGEDRLLEDLHLCHLQALTESSTFTIKQETVRETRQRPRGYSAPETVQTVDDERYDSAFKDCMLKKGWAEGRGPKAVTEEPKAHPSEQEIAGHATEGGSPPAVLPLEGGPQLHWDTEGPPEADIFQTDELPQVMESPSEAIPEHGESMEATATGEKPETPMKEMNQETVMEPVKRVDEDESEESGGALAGEPIEGTLDEPWEEELDGMENEATEEIVDEAGQEDMPKLEQ